MNTTTKNINILLNDKHQMPQLGFGVWQMSDDEAENAVAQALNIGYRSVDTAAIYENEKGVGRALKKTALSRNEIFVTTKVWNEDQGYAKTLRAFDKSLLKLGLDYIDLYLIHWASPHRELYVETWEALTELKEKGKVKSIGVSNFEPEHLQKIIEATGEVPVVNQIELHPRFQQRNLQAFHRRYEIRTECWSPLGQGGEILKNPTLLAIAKKHNKTTAQIILRWHIENGFIAIPKSITPQRIKENFEIFDFTLDSEDIRRITELDNIDGRIGPNPLTAEF